MPAFNFRQVNKSKYKNHDPWTAIIEHKIAFISYTGEYPNLCTGILTISIDNIVYIFERGSLGSGGACRYNSSTGEYEAELGHWTIDAWPDDPIFLDIKVRETILHLVNTSVAHGCCGGCA